MTRSLDSRKRIRMVIKYEGITLLHTMCANMGWIDRERGIPQAYLRSV